MTRAEQPGEPDTVVSWSHWGSLVSSRRLSHWLWAPARPGLTEASSSACFESQTQHALMIQPSPLWSACQTQLHKCKIEIFSFISEVAWLSPAGGIFPRISFSLISHIHFHSQSLSVFTCSGCAFGFIALLLSVICQNLKPWCISEVEGSCNPALRACLFH